mgnify:CR=1 FL=1
MDDPKPHVLVVEDDKQLRELFRRYLTEIECDVWEAGSADEAFPLALEADLVVLDLGLNGQNGHGLLSRLREVGCYVPVVIVTGEDPDDGDRRTRLEALEIVFWFQKGGPLSQVIHVIQRALGAMRDLRSICEADGKLSLLIETARMRRLIA